MIDLDLARHAREFLRAIRNFKYERTPGGMLFPEQLAIVRGLYTHRIRNPHTGLVGPWVEDWNLLPTEGINRMLDNLIAANGSTAYISLYAGAIDPAANWTAASYPATASEITSGAEGYSESVRQTWSAAAASSGTKDNYSTPASFTMVTASSVNVWGVGMHTVSTKGGVTGYLLSATRFGAQRTFSNTDQFDVKYRLTITST